MSMNRFLKEPQRRAIIDCMVNLDNWMQPLGFDVCMAVIDHLDSCFQYKSQKPICDIHPSVKNKQYNVNRRLMVERSDRYGV